MQKQFFVYIMANKSNTVLYTGMTNNLLRRISEHRAKRYRCFTMRYNVIKLVYYEVFADPYHAILREKQIKAGSRRRKIKLIETMNPAWKDLSGEL